MNTNFYSLWFDPTGNRTRVYCISIRRSIHSTTDRFLLSRYYPLLATELALNVIGAVFCAVYYVGVHKTRAFTAHAYPAAARVLFCCFFPTNPDDECFHWLPVRKDWTVCKQVETSELFFLTKDQLETFRQV